MLLIAVKARAARLVDGSSARGKAVVVSLKQISSEYFMGFWEAVEVLRVAG